MTAAHDDRGPVPAPVTVLMGGPSAEHDVSIVSGTAIAEALETDGRSVEQVVVDLDGGWWWLPTGHRRGDRPAAAYDRPSELGATGPVTPGVAIDRLASSRLRPIVFLALHGPWGEDGTVQALLEAVGLCYTGSGVAASAVGMDKALFKRLVRGLGLPIVDWREIHAVAWAADRTAVLAELEAFARSTGDPRLMIKPAGLGSSVGMTLAHDAAERSAGIDLALRFDRTVLAERYVAGARELEVAILGNDASSLELYGPGEVLSGHEFYDYQAKYAPGLSETMVRAELDAPVRAAILKIARDAYRAIGAAGFARVDFLLDGDVPYLSEINTIPGFTPISLFPSLPASAGLDFPAVCRRVLDLAVERCASRVDRHLTPEDLPR